MQAVEAIGRDRPALLESTVDIINDGEWLWIGIGIVNWDWDWDWDYDPIIVFNAFPNFCLHKWVKRKDTYCIDLTIKENKIK